MTSSPVDQRGIEQSSVFQREINSLAAQQASMEDQFHPVGKGDHHLRKEGLPRIDQGLSHVVLSKLVYRYHLVSADWMMVRRVLAQCHQVATPGVGEDR